MKLKCNICGSYNIKVITKNNIEEYRCTDCGQVIHYTGKRVYDYPISYEKPLNLAK